MSESDRLLPFLDLMHAASLRGGKHEAYAAMILAMLDAQVHGLMTRQEVDARMPYGLPPAHPQDCDRCR